MLSFYRSSRLPSIDEKSTERQEAAGMYRYKNPPVASLIPNIYLSTYDCYRSRIAMVENYPAGDFVGMRSSRRTAIATIVREREARRKQLLDECKRRLSPMEPRNVEASIMLDETPFDENPRPPKNDTGMHRQAKPGLNNFDAGCESSPSAVPPKSFTVDNRERSLGKQKATRHVLKHQTIRVPFDESQVRDDSFDSVNMSSLVQFRSEQEKHREQAVDQINQSNAVSRRNILVGTTCHRTFKYSGNDHGRLDIDRSHRNFGKSEVPIRGIPRIRNDDVDVLQQEKVLFFFREEERERELPSDEEASQPSNGDQSCPSLDDSHFLADQKRKGAEMTLERKLSTFKVADAIDTIVAPTSILSDRKHSSSLAIEVSKFLVLKSIVERARLSNKKCEASASVYSSRSQNNQREINDEPKPLRKFTRASIVGIKTSERIMRSVHSGSTRSTIENIVVWSASRDTAFDHRDDSDNTLPTPEKFSKIRGKQGIIESDQDEDEIGSSIPQQYRSQPHPAPETIGLPSLGESSISSLGGDSISTNETSRQYSCGDVNSPSKRKSDDFAKYECTVPANMRVGTTPQRVWSFYDPLEVQALSLAAASHPAGASSTFDDELRDDGVDCRQTCISLSRRDNEPSSEYDCSLHSFSRQTTIESDESREVENINNNKLRESHSQASVRHCMETRLDEEIMHSNNGQQENPNGRLCSTCHRSFDQSAGIGDALGIDIVSDESTVSQDTSMISGMDPNIEQFDNESNREAKLTGPPIYTPRHSNKLFFDERSSHLENIFQENDDNSGTVPDFAIEEVFDLMDRFKAEHEKNKYVFRERNLRRKSLLVESTQARTSTRGGTSNVPPDRTTIVLDRCSLVGETENCKTEFHGLDDGMHREAMQPLHNRHLTELVNEGRCEKLRSSFELNTIDHEPVDERDDHPEYERNLDGINLVKVASERTMQGRQYHQPFCLCHGEHNVMQSLSGTDSALESFERSIFDQSTSRYDSVVDSSYVGGKVPTVTHSSSNSQPSMDFPSKEGRYRSLSSFDSASLVDSLSEPETHKYGRRLGRDFGELISAASGTGLNPYRGPATKQMLELFSLGRRPFVDAINSNDLGQSHDFACKCTAMSFGGE